MSKRSGDFVSLDELLDDIGVDAARWFMLWRSHDTTVDLDLDLARRESSDNPVYYVQYAHARIASILRKAGRGGVGRGRGRRADPGHAARADREGAGQAPARVPRRGPRGRRAPRAAPDLRLLDRRRRRLPRLLPRLPGGRRRGRGRRGLAPRPLPADQADDRRRPRPARHLGPGADVKPLAEIRGRSRDSVRAGTLRRSDLEAFGALLEQDRRAAPVLVTGAGDGRLAVSTGLASAAAARRRAHRAGRVRPRGADPGRRPRPRRRARPARVPARRSRRRPRSCSRWSSPARPRQKATDPLVCIVAGEPGDRRQGADRLGRLPPRGGETAQRLRPRRPPRPAARRRERRPAGGRRRRRTLVLACVGPLARHGPRRAPAEEGAARGCPAGGAEVVVYG